MDYFFIEYGLNFETKPGEGFTFNGAVMDPVIKGTFLPESAIAPAIGLIIISVLSAIWPAIRAAGYNLSKRSNRIKPMLKLITLAFRNLLRNKRRSLITLGAISMGLAIMLLGQSLQYGSYQANDRQWGVTSRWPCCNTRKRIS